MRRAPVYGKTQRLPPVNRPTTICPLP